ncbi:MAG: type II toxin-antitoxin system RelE/ParE family toxin [Rhizomicrobium sp.]
MKVIIHEAACNDLENIVGWIAKDSPTSARSVAERVLDTIENKIPLFPRIGRIGKVEGTREWILRGLPYIVVYQIDEAREAVTILGIFHGAQQR